jgi:Cu+-exporting ATPase
MDCANCARKVTTALTGVAGVDSATVDLAAGRADVRWKPDQIGNPMELVAAVAAAGYTAEPEAPGSDIAASVPPENPWKPALRLGIPVTVLLLVGDWVLRLGMDRSFQWVAFLLATPVQFWVGGRFYRGAWRQARVGQSNMDTLVSLGSTAAFGFSVWGLFTGYHGHLYFMEAAAILTLISAGHWLEARMSTRAGTALKALLELAPSTARRLNAGSCTEQDVPVATLKPGDSIVIRPGDRIPVDALVLAGESAVDESMLTGEPVPVDKGTGSKLYTGTAIANGRLVARVEATGEATALAHIIAAVQRAQSSRAQVQRLADRVSSVFVPIVVLIALATAAWWGFGYDSASAMGLATPAALMAGVNAAARRGILIRDAVALEKSGRVTDIVFDKTGTLTVGHPTVVDSLDLRPDSNRQPSLAALAAALASPSRHPLSQSLAQGFGNDGLPAVSAWREIRGSGLESAIPELGSGTFRLGSGAWFEGLGIPLSAAAAFVASQAGNGASVVFLAADNQLLGAIAVRDALKPNARSVIERLQKSGLRVHLLTGDRKETAFVVARELGLEPDAVAAGVRPEQKAEVLRRLQESGARVAFVGDGLNDGPALAQADLGIAVTQATDVAKEAADILLLQSDLGAIPQALDLAQATLRVIRQNLFWAFFYNAAAIPLAVTGLLSPVLCAAAMGFSDVIVIGNALRLNRR